ncbi:MAG: HCO3- transporter [Planctomycetes bacterium]|nr:HCO3- transporter [Planctomycetota bacterium]
MTSRPTPASSPSPSSVSEGLQFTGRFAGGLRDDLRRRLPHYLHDFTSGIHPKVLASTLFLFFACLANAIAFGGLTGLVTEGQIGTVEMIVATAAGGVLFALLSGQPLTLLGGTGPIVVFTGLLYTACGQLELPFLPVYMWTGVWSGVLLIVLAVTDASALMRYFTRFTDEIFAALIAVIFIVEAVTSLLGPLGDDAAPARGLLTLVLGLGTFALARGMRNFQRSRYMWRTLRAFISDFGPAIAIGLMTWFAVANDAVRVEAPAVPEQFATTSGRSWWVDPFALPTWAIFASLAPAIMATILLFLDQNITTRLVNAGSNRLTKGSGFHLDLFVVGGITVASSCFGLPWIVAATVHSLNHVKSLATVRTVPVGGGESREVIASVRENRVSALAIHLLIGLSVLLLSWIQMIPMAVLFGLFLYMGFTTLGGNQFFERVMLWVTDPHLYPTAHYTNTVKHRRIHLFTLVQAAALAALWVLKASAIGILFPVLIALLVPLRLLLGRWFTRDELAALDSEEGADEPDELMADAHG